MATQRIEAQLQGGGTGVSVGENIAIDFVFNTDDGSKVASLDFQSYFNSNELQFNSISVNTAAGGSPLTEENIDDTADGDTNADTNKQIRYGVLDVSGTFPTGTLPVTIYTANFTVLEGFDGNTPINIAGTSDGTFSPVNLDLTLDVDEAPVVADPIEDIVVGEDDPDTIIDLIPVFSDPDGDPFTAYTVTSSDSTKIAARIDGTNLILDYQPEQFGNDIQITVTAEANGKTVADDFLVDIEESTAPVLTKVDGKNLFKVSGDPGNVKLTLKEASSGEITSSDVSLFVVDDADQPVNDDAGNPLTDVVLSSVFRNPEGFPTNPLVRTVAVPDQLFSEGTNLGIELNVKTSEDDEEGGNSISSLNSEFITITEIDTDGDGALDGVFDVVYDDGSTRYVLEVGGTEDLAPSGTASDSSAIIDLSGRTAGESITFSTEIFRQASQDNVFGIYEIDDAAGSIVTDSLTGATLTPGSADLEEYTNAALDRLTGSAVAVGQGAGAVDSGDITLEGGKRYGLFIITDVNFEDDGSVDTALEEARDGSLEVYFPFLGANSDEASHFKLLADNVFGVEDLDGGGDQDFNDAIFSITEVTA
jgi:hypothetical protein